MATKNSRNGRYLLCATKTGTYIPVAGAFGYKENVPTDFSEDTTFGAFFKSYIPGLQDYKATLMRRYDTADATVEKMSKTKTSEYFLFYPDYADTLNYTRGQTFLGQDEHDNDLGKTVDQKYTAVIANSDLEIVRNGAAL